MADGRHKISPDELFAMEAKYKSKDAHRLIHEVRRLNALETRFGDLLARIEGNSYLMSNQTIPLIATAIRELLEGKLPGEMGR